MTGAAKGKIRDRHYLHVNIYMRARRQGICIHLYQARLINGLKMRWKKNSNLSLLSSLILRKPEGLW